MNKIFYENKTSKKTKTKDEIFNEILDKINDLDVKNIYVDKEGSIYIINEFNYMNYFNSYNGSYSVKFYNNEIITFILNKEGELKKTKIVPKKQTSNSYDDMGSICLFQNKNLGFIYNDHNDNFNLKKVNKNNGNNFSYDFKYLRNSRLAYVSYDNNGNIEKVPLTESMNKNFNLYSRTYLPISYSSGIIWGKTKGHAAFVLFKISLED